MAALLAKNILTCRANQGHEYIIAQILKATAAPGNGRFGNARKHCLFTPDAIAKRKQAQALLGEARKLLPEMK